MSRIIDQCANGWVGHIKKLQTIMGKILKQDNDLKLWQGE